MQSESHTSANTGKPLNVYVCSPFGTAGKGGIDRLVDSIFMQSRHEPDLRLTRLTTRGRMLIGSLLYLPLAMARLILARATDRIDVLHVNLASYGSTYRKIALCGIASLLNIPYVVHLHGAEYRDFWGAAPKWLRHYIRRMFCRAHSIIALGTVWRDFIAEIAPSAISRIEVLPNASLPRAHGRAEKTETEPVRIVFTGQLGTRKGTPELVEALRRIGDDGTWQSVLAGDGDIESTRSLVADAGLSGCVDITGWLDEHSIDAELARADVLVLPSHAENLPMSVIEGMAHGLAIITTPVGAIGDIIKHERTGLLVAAGDADGLCAAIKSVIANPALRREIGTNARAFHAAHLAFPGYLHRLSNIWLAAAGEGKPIISARAMETKPQQAPRR